MFQHWIQPLDTSQWSALEAGSHGFSDNIFKAITEKSGHTPGVALIGVNKAVAWQVRSQLYRFVKIPSVHNIVMYDLGDFKKEAADFIIPAIKAFIESKVIPILLFNADDHKYLLFQVFEQLGQPYQALMLDESVQPEDQSMDRLTNGGFQNCQAFTFLGLQRHLTPDNVLHTLRDTCRDVKRLGEMREEFEDNEPVVRDSHFLHFHISALNMAAAPGQSGVSSSGLSGEEACQIMHYAGLSQALKCLAFSGISVKKDHGLRTANILAQMIWYYLHAVTSSPSEHADLTEYVVAFKRYPLHLSFYKNEKSGRWWVDIPTNSGAHTKRYSCTYNDYKTACHDMISDRISRIVNHML